MHRNSSFFFQLQIFIFIESINIKIIHLSVKALMSKKLIILILNFLLFIIHFKVEI